MKNLQHLILVDLFTLFTLTYYNTMDVRRPASASEKAEVEKIQDVAATHNLGKSGTETGSDPAIGSFVDVDEKKVLRKVRRLSYGQEATEKPACIIISLTVGWYRWMFD